MAVTLTTASNRSWLNAECCRLTAPVQPRRAKALAGFRTATPLHKQKRDTRAMRPGVEGSLALVKERPFRCKVQGHSSQTVLSTSLQAA